MQGNPEPGARPMPPRLRVLQLSAHSRLTKAYLVADASPPALVQLQRVSEH